MEDIQSNPKSVVYGLWMDGAPTIRYVGMTTSPILTRLRGHRFSARKGKNLPISNWIRKHGEHNLRWTILGSESDLSDLKQLEVDTIGRYRQSGHELLNLTDGGDGVLGWVPSPQERVNRSARMTGAGNPSWGTKSSETGVRNQLTKTGKPGPWAGKKRSPETCAKLSASVTGRRFVIKLNPDKVREIRRLFKEEGMMQTKIAERFEVSPQVVCNVLKGVRWSWVK